MNELDTQTIIEWSVIGILVVLLFGSMAKSAWIRIRLKIKRKEQPPRLEDRGPQTIWEKNAHRRLAAIEQNYKMLECELRGGHHWNQIEYIPNERVPGEIVFRCPCGKTRHVLETDLTNEQRLAYNTLVSPPRRPAPRVVKPKPPEPEPVVNTDPDGTGSGMDALADQE